MENNYKVCNFGVLLVTLILLPKGGDATDVVAKADSLATTSTTMQITVEVGGTGSATDALSLGGAIVETVPSSADDFQPQLSTELDVTSTTGIHISATGLSPYTPYVLKITGATSDGGTTPLTGTATLDQDFCTMAGEVSGLQVSDDGTTETAIKLTWTAPTGTAPESYEVYIGDYMMTATTTELLIEEKDAEGTALEAGNDYICKVKSKYTSDSGSCAAADYGTSAEMMITCSTDGGDDDKECSAVGLGLSKMTILAILYGMFFS